jgi:nicotinate-nucleotide adenylyltransferase
LGLVPHRLGLFGGTFDPPHRGHVVAATAVLRDLGLDEVILMVAGDPWQKTAGSRPVTPAETRLEMTRAAVATTSGLIVAADEVTRSGPSYTVDTVAELVRRRPGTEVWAIVGADTASRIATWRDYRRLAASATMVAVTRPGHLLDDRESGIDWEVIAIEPVEVSSTLVRERIAAGDPTSQLVADGWLDPAVAAIIDRDDLYRSGVVA